MRKTKYTVKPTTQFKKDYKLAMKRGLNISLLEDVVTALAMGEPLPDKNKDHGLSGDWAGQKSFDLLQFRQKYGIIINKNCKNWRDCHGALH